MESGISATYGAQAAAWAAVAVGAAGVIKSAVSTMQDADAAKDAAAAAAAEAAEAQAETQAAYLAEAAAAESQTAIRWTVITDETGTRSLEPVFEGASLGMSWEPDETTEASYSADTTDYAVLLDWTGGNAAATKQAADTATAAAQTATQAAQSAAASAASSAGSSSTAATQAASGSAGSGGSGIVSDALNGVRLTKQQVNVYYDLAAGKADYDENTASSLPAGASFWAGDYTPVEVQADTAQWGGSSGSLTAALQTAAAADRDSSSTGSASLWGGSSGLLLMQTQAAETVEDSDVQNTDDAEVSVLAAEYGASLAESSDAAQAAEKAAAAETQAAATAAAAEYSAALAGSSDAAAEVRMQEAGLSAEDSDVQNTGGAEASRFLDPFAIQRSDCERERRCDGAAEIPGPLRDGNEAAESASTAPAGQGYTQRETQAILEAAISGGGAAGGLSFQVSDTGGEHAGAGFAGRAGRARAAGANTRPDPESRAGLSPARAGTADGNGLSMEQVLSGLTQQFAQRLAVSGEGVHR